MSAPFTIKQGDTLPSLTAILKDDGTAADLTGATVKFEMRKRRSCGSAASVVIAETPATNLDDGAPNRGKVRYSWANGQTADHGKYYAVFRVTIGGKTKTYPTKGFIPVTVYPQLDT